jgi:hypothetical protein
MLRPQQRERSPRIKLSNRLRVTASPATGNQRKHLRTAAFVPLYARDESAQYSASVQVGHRCQQRLRRGNAGYPKFEKFEKIAIGFEATFPPWLCPIGVPPGGRFSGIPIFSVAVTNLAQ